jgi:hypothetical protein
MRGRYIYIYEKRVRSEGERVGIGIGIGEIFMGLFLGKRCIVILIKSRKLIIVGVLVKCIGLNK